MDTNKTAGRVTLLALMGLLLGAPLALNAQVPLDPNGEPVAPLEDGGYIDLDSEDTATLSDAELEDLVGPVALYPDDLLAIVLPASTYPLEIVQAARFLDELAKDSTLEPDESWDESVVALLNYPEVVYMMDKEIDWTWRLGEAVISQQADVLAAVESFRERAYAAGNLESDERQTVSNDDGVIEIDPVDDDIIYVPYYEPEEVVVYQPRRVYYYYPYAYPVYYYPYPVGYSFATGYFWGVTTAFTIGWHNHYLHVHHPSYWGHPYYGHHYYGHYYRRPSISVYNHWYVRNSFRTSQHRYRDGDYWRPRHHRSGARPATERVRSHYYTGGNWESRRDATRSNERTRQYARQRTGLQTTAGTNTRPRNARDADRARHNVSSNRVATAVVEENGNRRGRTESRQPTRTTADRQRLAAVNSRQATSDSRARHEREVVLRNAPSRVSRANRTSGTSNRQATRSQAPVQRQTSRATVQRQAPAPRQATRPAVQQQAPSRAPAAAPQRESRPASAPAKRSQGGRRRQRH